jgi:hypothetical protein
MPVGNDAGLLRLPQRGVDVNAGYIGCDMFDPANYYGSSSSSSTRLRAGWRPIVVTVFRDRWAVVNPPAWVRTRRKASNSTRRDRRLFHRRGQPSLGMLDLVHRGSGRDAGDGPVQPSRPPRSRCRFGRAQGNDHPTGPRADSRRQHNRVMNATMRGGTIWVAHTPSMPPAMAAPLRPIATRCAGQIGPRDRAGRPAVRHALRPSRPSAATRTARST